MTTTTLRTSAVNQLRASLRGEVVQPRDPAYDAARAGYNAMHERWPALVVRAEDADDVAVAIEFARAHGLLLAVRGGNHSVPGFGSCDDGLALDLSRMHHVHIDPEARVARAQGGCTWGQLNDAAHAFGLGTTSGLISTTGIAGLTLGGGIGYMARAWGLACDNLVGAEVVTANGERLHCSVRGNADLFWGLRGGGGNFGVVTSLEYRLHPAGDILAGPLFFPLSADIVRGYRDFMQRAPERLGAVLGLTLAPPLPFLAEELHGKPVAVVIVCWIGPPEEGEAVIQPLEQCAPVLGRGIRVMPYPAINTLFDALLPRGLRHYWKSQFVREVPDAAIDLHVEHAARVPSLESGTFFYPIDGACHRVASDATAFPQRAARFAIGIHGSWRAAADDTRSSAWVRACYDATRPYALEGEYVNFISDDGNAGVPSNYGQNYARLLALKRRLDAHNLFCLNQNIDPQT